RLPKPGRHGAPHLLWRPHLYGEPISSLKAHRSSSQLQAPQRNESMKPEPTTVTVSLAGGKTISFETGKLAKQAHGSAVVRMGENVVLATATANADPREGIDFFPLTVDY